MRKLAVLLCMFALFTAGCTSKDEKQPAETTTQQTQTVPTEPEETTEPETTEAEELSEKDLLKLLRKQMDIPHAYTIEETYIDMMNFQFKQETIQKMAQDGSWYYKVDRSYSYPMYNREEAELMEYYYVYEGEDLVCYVKDKSGKIDRSVIPESVMEQMDQDRKAIDSGYTIYPKYMEDFQSQGIDEATGLDCYTFNLPVQEILKDRTMASQLIMMAMDVYGTKYNDIWGHNVQCTTLVDPETMCTMALHIDYEELKPYVMAEGSISAEYALKTNFFVTDYTFEYELPETTVLPEEYK